MKSESEIAERLANLRKRLESVKHDRKAKPTGGGGSNVKELRLLEGRVAELAWVLGVPDAGPTPPVW
jgi:hypothetical protein